MAERALTAVVKKVHKAFKKAGVPHHSARDSACLTIARGVT